MKLLRCVLVDLKDIKDGSCCIPICDLVADDFIDGVAEYVRDADLVLFGRTDSILVNKYGSTGEIFDRR
jgi:hypothetical protein